MDKIAFIIYLVCIVFGVLFFGAIHTWAYTIVFLGVIAASLLLLKGAVVRMDAPLPPQESNHRRDVLPSPEGERDGRLRGARPGWYLKWVTTDLTPLFFFFFAFLILQMHPLPGFLLALISPEAKLAGEMSLPAAALDPTGLAGQWYSLVPYIYPVRMSLIRWVVYGLLFFGLIRCLNSRKRIEAAIVTILLLATFDALYGIMQTYSGYGHILWFRMNRYRQHVSGTFLYYNLFAGFLEMAITLAVAYASGLGGAGQGQTGPSIRRSFAKRFLAFFSENPNNLKRFLIVFAGGVMGLGLILSNSRGGIIAVTGALLMMGIFFYSRKSERRNGRIILILFGIAMIFAIHAGLDYTIGRFYFFDESMRDRGIMAEKTLNLFKDYSIAGVGIGNFSYAYGKYQDPTHKKYFVDFAHNDYAQFLAEAGIVGAVLLLAGVGWYFVRTFRIWRKRSDPFAVCLGIAPFIALFAVAIHAYSDFNLHRPAHMMVLVAVVAIGYAALHLENRHHRDRMLYRQRMIPLRPWGAALLTCTAGLIIWCGVWTVRHFVAETYCNTDYNITLNLEKNPPAENVRKAKIWNPGNAAYHHKLALALTAERNRRMQQPAPDTEGWKQSHGPIIENLERSIRLNPMNAQAHVHLGWEYSYLFDRPDHFTRWLPAADVCMNRAVWFAGNWVQYPRLQYDMGNYWTMRSKTLGPDDPKSEINWTRAVWHYRKGMELEQKKDLPEGVKAYIRNFFTDAAHLQLF